MARRARTSADRVLDLFVYAPIGMLVAAVERLPEFVESGREVMHRGASPQVPEDNAIAEPFIGYDAMSAQELIGQLNELDSELLHQVQEYELLHRNRRTVIARVEQLLEGRQ